MAKCCDAAVNFIDTMDSGTYLFDARFNKVGLCVSSCVFYDIKRIIIWPFSASQHYFLPAFVLPRRRRRRSMQCDQNRNQNERKKTTTNPEHIMIIKQNKMHHDLTVCERTRENATRRWKNPSFVRCNGRRHRIIYIFFSISSWAASDFFASPFKVSEEWCDRWLNIRFFFVTIWFNSIDRAMCEWRSKYAYFRWLLLLSASSHKHKLPFAVS